MLVAATCSTTPDGQLLLQVFTLSIPLPCWAEAEKETKEVSGASHTDETSKAAKARFLRFDIRLNTPRRDLLTSPPTHQLTDINGHQPTPTDTNPPRRQSKNTLCPFSSLVRMSQGAKKDHEAQPGGP